MAYDETLAQRIRKVLTGHTRIEERKMFGGLAFLAGGHMCCGIVGSDLMVRVGPEHFEEALAAKFARPMDFTGRPSKGMVYVAPEGVRTEKALRDWIARGLRFAETLPPK
jgi:TfoX/Sxy family transcriptional regulator of competence genes